MERVRCPKCGGSMRPMANLGTTREGKKIVSYVCENKWKCGYVEKRVEDK